MKEKATAMDEKNLKLHTNGHDDFVAELTREYEALVKEIENNNILASNVQKQQISAATRRFKLKVGKARLGLF